MRTLQEIENHLSALYAEKKLVEAAANAENSTSLISILPKCTFFIDDCLRITIICEGRVGNDFDKIVDAIGQGYNHFEICLTAQIKISANDGRYSVYFDADATSEEKYKQECDARYQFRKIIAFLKLNGVEAKQFNIEQIEKYVDAMNKRLTDAMDTLNYAATEIIT
jgi:hypothetical protein